MRHSAVMLFILTLFSCTTVVKEYKDLKSGSYKKHFVSGRQPVYSGDSLRSILFPIGGIGTGNILLGGRGEINAFEIFGRPATGEHPYMTFFTIWIKEIPERTSVEEIEFEPIIKILEGRLPDHSPGPWGESNRQQNGIPRFEKAFFKGEYPFANIRLSDSEVALDIEMEAFNPFIPLDVDNSSIPAAVFHWKLKNPFKKNVEVSVAFSMANPFFGYNDWDQPTTRNTINEKMEIDGFTGIRMLSPERDQISENYGEFAIISLPDAGIQTHGYQGAWWDHAHNFWEDFGDDGVLKSTEETAVNPGGQPDIAVVWVKRSLQPGEEIEIPFILTWYIPARITEPDMAFGNEEAMNLKIFNYYSTKYSGVKDVTDYILKNRPYLYDKTKAYHDAVFSSSYPDYVIDAVTANTASLKSNLLLRDQPGRVHGFEGLGDDNGCCAGNCTHVWNYAQTMAFLFPSLERAVREVSYLHDTHENGYQCFRTTFPPGDYWFKNVCADGQMGNVMRVYREWKLSGDSEWLAELWPKIKLSLEFAWKGANPIKPGYEWQKNAEIPWDPEKEGVIRGDQHNTYDIDFYGPNMMTGSLYLGALKACAEIAGHFGEKEIAGEYMELYNKGRTTYEQLLWNGEYYVQKVEVIDGLNIPERLRSPETEGERIIPKYQFGDGCLADQLLGQFHAHITGMGYLLDEERVKEAMKSIYRHNFKSSLSKFQNVQRVYAMNDEGGLLACTWPHGYRPLFPFVYADEVWTGIEYQAATNMIYAGLVDEGLEVVQAVRNRYRGYNRNPWSEIESGRFYARSMASWGVLIALSGFEYDGVNKTIGFNPKINQDDFNTFWSCGSGWGMIRIDGNSLELSVLLGNLEIRELRLPEVYDYKSIEEINKGKADLKISAGKIILQFPETIILSENENLIIKFRK